MRTTQKFGNRDICFPTSIGENRRTLVRNFYYISSINLKYYYEMLVPQDIHLTDRVQAQYYCTREMKDRLKPFGTRTVS